MKDNGSKAKQQRRFNGEGLKQPTCYFSLDLVTQGDLYLGMENMLEFEVSVFDADDVTGDDLTYTWVGGASSTPLAAAVALAE